MQLSNLTSLRGTIANAILWFSLEIHGELAVMINKRPMNTLQGECITSKEKAVRDIFSQLANMHA